MNTAYKLMTGKEVSTEELKYLLWLCLLELEAASDELTVASDHEECFNIVDLLDSLETQILGEDK